jgi:hypothetical protein
MRTALALLLLATPVGLAHAQATNTPAPSVTVKEETPGLMKSAKVTAEAATRTAAARVPTGHVKSAEIEKEDGKLIYSFDIVVPRQEGIQEVNVDAMTGAVIGVEHESAAAEQKEKADDKQGDAEDKDPDAD